MRMPRSIFGVLAVTVVAAACSSTSADAPKPSQDPNAPGLVDDGGVAPSVKLSDSSAGDADANTACEELGDLSATGLTASYDSDSRWFTGAVPGRPSLTELTVLGVGTPSSLQGNVVALGTGVNANYATCTHCVIVLVGCTATDCNSARRFFAEAGSAYFNQVSSGPGQPFAGQLADVTLQEVTLDASYTSTNVPNGACLHLSSFAFNAKTLASATDAGAASDAGNGTGTGGRGAGSIGSQLPGRFTKNPLVGGGSEAGVCQPADAVCFLGPGNCCAPLVCIGAFGAQSGICQ